MIRALLLSTAAVIAAPAVALDRGPPAQASGFGSTAYGPLNCAPGLTCDASGISVTPNGSAAPGTLARLLWDLQQLTNGLNATLTWTVCASGCTFTNPIDAWDAARNIGTIGQFASIIIQVANGTYTINRPFYTESPNTAAVKVVGNTTIPASVVFNFNNIAGTNGSGIIALSKGAVGRPGTPGFDGITLTGVGARTGNSTWVSQSYGGAVQALSGGYIHVGGNVVVQNFYYSMVADEGGVIYADAGFTGNNAGDVNIFARHGGVIHCNSCKANVASHIFTNQYGQSETLGANFMAEAGGHLYIDKSTGTGAQVLGAGARLGGTMWAHAIEISGSAAAGLHVDEGGRAEFGHAKTHNNAVGALIMQGGIANLDAVNAYSNTFDGISIQSGTAFGSGLIVQNNGGYGIKVTNRGYAEFYGTQSSLTGNSAGAFFVQVQTGCTAMNVLCTPASALVLN